MKLTGFQTLKDKGDPGDIEEHGPFRCTRDDAWLGFGYYFWDSKIEWAHWWGEKSYNNSYIICKSVLVLDESCFDLVGNISHREDFLEAIDILKSELPFRSNQVVTVSNVIEYLKRQGLFDYNSIRSQH